MNTQKGFSNILLIIIGLLFISGGVYFYTNNNSVTDEVSNEEELNFEDNFVLEPFISETNEGNIAYPGDTVLIEGGNFSNLDNFEVGLTPSFENSIVKDIILPYSELTDNSFMIKIPNDVDINLHGGYHIYIEYGDNNRIKEPFGDIYPQREESQDKSLSDRYIEDGNHYVIITDIFKENGDILISFDLVQRKNNDEIVNESPLIRTLKTSENFEATNYFKPFGSETEEGFKNYDSEQMLIESRNSNSFMGSVLEYDGVHYIRIEDGYITNFNPGYWPG